MAFGLIRWLCILLALPAAVFAAEPTENVVLGLSKAEVAITTRFDGSEILIFGAVKREVAIPAGPPLEVIVTVAGPSQPTLVRRKANRFGIWINADAVEVDAAPSFYAVATSGPMDRMLSDTEDLRHRVTVERAIRSVGAPQNIHDSESFTQALIRIRERADLYQTLIGQVAVDEQTLFRTRVRMPANLTEGDYSVRILLTRDGAVVSDFDTAIDVRKVGLERWLYTLAHEQAILYGLMSLAIAIAAGWGASAVFRLLQQS